MPNLRQDDIDKFEHELGVFLRMASGEDLRKLATRAGRYLENRSQESGNVNMVHINNATSALCSMVRELSAERDRLRGEVEELRKQLPSVDSGNI